MLIGIFILGWSVGGLCGVMLMCLLFVSRENDEREPYCLSRNNQEEGTP